MKGTTVQKRTTPRVATEVPVGVIRIVSDVGSHPKWWEAQVESSRTGEAYAKTWWTPTGSFEGAQVGDMAHWIAGTLINTAMMSQSMVDGL